MKRIIVTVDGWSSCGKSTLARQLAKELDFIFIDSGAMYRAITLYFSRHNVDLQNIPEIIEALSRISLEFICNPSNGNNEIWLNGENVEIYIRDIGIAEKVSVVATVKQVREFAVAQQQKIGENKGIVMDGRDIGTAVFPNAELKIFMTADVEVRVARRFRELVLKTPTITVEEVRSNLSSRDYIDSNRVVSPLRKAEDAITVDNSQLSVKEQFELVLKLAKEKMEI